VAWPPRRGGYAGCSGCSACSACKRGAAARFDRDGYTGCTDCMGTAIECGYAGYAGRGVLFREVRIVGLVRPWPDCPNCSGDNDWDTWCSHYDYTIGTGCSHYDDNAIWAVFLNWRADITSRAVIALQRCRQDPRIPACPMLHSKGGSTTPSGQLGH